MTPVELAAGDPILTLAALFVVAAVAGFIDALAGGGGLITVPVLLLTGLSPLQAIGTSKLQAVAGTAVAATRLIRRGGLTRRTVGPPLFLALIGGVAGTAALRCVSAEHLDVVIPVVLAGIAAYVLLTPRAGDVAGAERISGGAYSVTVAPLIGLYDGFFGPGAGSFYAVSGVALRGWDIVRATANAKVFNLASSLPSVVILAYGGHVMWLAGCVMVAGQLVGSTLGARTVMGGGARLIRPLIVTVSLLMIARYVIAKGLTAI